MCQLISAAQLLTSSVRALVIELFLAIDNYHMNQCALAARGPSTLLHLPLVFMLIEMLK